MSKQNWFQEFGTRVGQTTPWFFRIAMKAGFACTGIGGGLLGLLIIPGFKPHMWMAGLGSNLLVAGVVLAVISKAATTTPQDLPNNQPNPMPKETPIDDQQH